MDYISLLSIALGLTMDAFAVAVTNGAITKNLKFNHALKIALCFGFFQALMPVIGMLIGVAGSSFIETVDHFIAFALLSYIGVKMIHDCIKESKKVKSCNLKEPIGLKMLIVMAIATSIDALATGVVLPSIIGIKSLSSIALAVSLIGLITFSLSLAGVYIGKKFGSMLSSKAQILGGLVLIIMGVKILIEHLF